LSKVKIQIPEEFERLLDTDWREASVYGGRFSLKSHTVARILLIRAMQSKVRVLCAREFQNSIADSSYQLLADLIEQYGLTMFSLTRDSIINNENGSDFLFKGVRHNSQNIKSIEGIDIGWVEEAQTITKDSIDVLTPTIRKEGSQIIWTYNRLTELDPIHKRLVIDKFPNTLVINVNYDAAERYGWLPDEIKQEIEHDKNTNPQLYAHKWLGEPIGQAEMAVISRDMIIKAMGQKVEDDGQEIVGVDVARMGNDRTVFWKRKGLATKDYEIHSKLRTTEVCDKLELFASYNKKTQIKVDDTGVGGGVTDDMMKRGYNVIGVNFGGEANDKDKYPNWISEAWFSVAEMMGKISLPQENDLIMELSTRQWKQDNKGKRAVESKNDYKKRGYRSPDLADAMIICYAEPKLNAIDWGDSSTAL
jgi:phage terminase large subunit